MASEHSPGSHSVWQPNVFGKVFSSIKCDVGDMVEIQCVIIKSNQLQKQEEIQLLPVCLHCMSQLNWVDKTQQGNGSYTDKSVHHHLSSASQKNKQLSSVHLALHNLCTYYTFSNILVWKIQSYHNGHCNSIYAWVFAWEGTGGHKHLSSLDDYLAYKPPSTDHV